MNADELKRKAAEEALRHVTNGMRLGLGTGSTARHFVELLALKARDGLQLTCVATSEETAAQARSLGLKLATLDDVGYLDLTVDGADEIDPQLGLIKGGGGALLREKIVASVSERMIVIADASKKVARLGRFPLPVEVVPFAARTICHMIETVAADVDCRGTIGLRLGRDQAPFRTDGGNYVVDCAFGDIPDAEALADALDVIPGVVEHGLFLGLADMALIAGPDGIEVIEIDFGEA